MKAYRVTRSFMYGPVMFHEGEYIITKDRQGESMTSNHIDQLAEWWETAETGPARKGDIVIEYAEYDPTCYTVFKVYGADLETCTYRRILHRAPKPKPAWHDAVAVIAHTDDGHVRQVWERDGYTGYWVGTEGCIAGTDALLDVIPLIEARVTDETLARVEAAFTDDHESFNARIRAITAAALGLDPDTEENA